MGIQHGYNAKQFNVIKHVSWHVFKEELENVSLKQHVVVGQSMRVFLRLMQPIVAPLLLKKF
jgi:hypothetical protein